MNKRDWGNKLFPLSQHCWQWAWVFTFAEC